MALWTGMVTIGSAQLAAAGVGRLPVTFNHDIAPIIVERCAGCHRKGGGAPFALDTYPDVRRRASLIAQVTQRRTMPPWKPIGEPGIFADDRRLSDQQVALIQRWVDEGASEGAGPSKNASAARPKQWDLGSPDQVVSMPIGYRLAADARDTIRSFVIPVASDRDRYVRGIEFHPETAGAVHHANIKIDVTGSSRRIDADDEEPGFEGSGRDAQFPDGQFLGWTPGQRPHVSTDDAWLLPAGADIVIELHLTPTGKREVVQAQIGLLFTDKPPSRSPYMLRLCNQHLDIPAGTTDYVSTDSYTVPADVSVLAVQPHAHNLARTMTGVAHLPDGQVKRLIQIEDWDFRWQEVYRFKEPVHLPRGTRVEMRFTYDNSEQNPRNPHRPPRRVTFGQTSDEEMGDLWLQVVTARPDDRAMLAADANSMMLREDTTGDEMMVAASPRDARLRRDLAYCYDAMGRGADALAQLAQAVVLEPASADGHYQLGTMLLKQRRVDEALAALRRATALRPDWSENHNNLGVALFLRGELNEASLAFDEALWRNPRNAEALFNRGRVLVAQGRHLEALAAFTKALEIRHDDPDTLVAAASASAAIGQVDDAARLYRDALRISPDLVPALTDLAWLLAAAEPRDANRASEAVRLAERAAHLSADNPVVLDTLAASYFAAGRADDAVRTAEAAVAAAERDGNGRAVRDIGERLGVYRSGRHE
jgi:tetratricopeptide (TPR) repeat protein